MNEVNYEELDPFVIPVIRYLREELGIDTEFSCQGMVKGEKKNPPHSLVGYISARYTDSALQTFQKIYELEKSRWPKLEEKKRGPRLKMFGRVRERVEIITVYLPVRQWETAEELKEEWNLIYEIVKQKEDGSTTKNERGNNAMDERVCHRRRTKEE